MEIIIVIFILVMLVITAITLLKKYEVKRYIRNNLPEVWHQLGMTAELDDNEIKKERNFLKYITSKSFEELGDEKFNKICRSYVGWGKVFQLCAVIWCVSIGGTLLFAVIK